MTQQIQVTITLDSTIADGIMQGQLTVAQATDSGLLLQTVYGIKKGEVSYKMHIFVDGSTLTRAD